MNYPNVPHPPGAADSSIVVLAVASIVLGILGFVGMIPTLLFTLCGILPMALGVGGAIAGFLAVSRAKKVSAGGPKAIGIIGIVISSLAALAPILYLAFVLLVYLGFAVFSKAGR